MIFKVKPTSNMKFQDEGKMKVLLALGFTCFTRKNIFFFVEKRLDNYNSTCNW